jgi:hypothetical protein
MARNTLSLKSLIKTGFGLGIGFGLSEIIFVLIGLAFFVPGYLMYTKSKSEKDTSGSSTMGIVLMVIGIAITGGLGFGTFLDTLGDN